MCDLTSHSNRMQTIRRMTVMTLAVMMLPWIMPPAAATTTTGTTIALINSEQQTHENSSAIPAFGFGMTADTAEALNFIWVYFSGWGFDSGNGGDIAPLNLSSAVSGVGLYRDSGITDDKLDASDAPITLDDIYWSGNYVYMDLTGNNEAVPATLAGSYQWIIAVRISASGNLDNGDEIDMAIFTDNINATSAGGYVSQPSSDVYANTLYIATVEMNNIMSEYWIGPSNVAVHEKGMAGISISDGGKALNSGINELLTGLSLHLQEDGGVITSTDFAPITTNSATSGIGFYRDDGARNDEWDPTDTAINFATISPTVFPLGGVVIDTTFSPGIPIPDSRNGSADFLIVVRSGSIVSGDYFYFTLDAWSVTTSGLLPADAGRHAVLPSYTSGSYSLGGDDTPPQITDAYWQESSAYLATDQDTLYFNHLMPTRQNATVRVSACDGESNLKNVTWSSEAVLANSPPAANLSASWYCYTPTTFTGFYGFNSASGDSDSPIDFWVTDRVGNMVSAVESGYMLEYEHQEAALIMRGDPGWYSPDWPLYVDDSGVLWFSDKIGGSAWVYLEVAVVSLYGGGVKNVSASKENMIDGPDNPFDTWGPGNTNVWFDTAFTFHANSTTDGAVTITALDHSANTISMDFQIRRDVEGPAIRIIAPTSASPITGNFIVWANVTDAGAGVDWVEVGIDPDNGTDDMIFDGTNWYYEFSSNVFTDGPHTIIVEAGDNVYNRRAATVNVQFGNGVLDSVPPRVGIISPVDRAVVHGTTTVVAMAMDNAGIGSVWVRVGQGGLNAATLNAATGYWEYSWDTGTSMSGDVMLSAIARDTFGNEVTSSVTVLVDNAAPRAQMAGPTASQEVAGAYTVQVFASDPGGVSNVTLTVAGRTVPMVYNPVTGYYEYTIDTRSLGDGPATARATVTDTSGQTTSTQEVTFSVKNGDAVRTLRDVSVPLFLLFAVIAFLVVLMLAMRGTFRKWMAPDSMSSMSSSTTTSRAEGEPTRTSATSTTTTSQMEPPKHM